MSDTDFYLVHFNLYKDPDSEKTIAEVPVLGIADYGADTPEALSRLKEMVRFHLECLLQEGKPLPEETAGLEG